MSSRLTVPMNLSAWQFARGQPGGILMTFEVCVGEAGVERGGELAGVVADQESEVVSAIAEIDQEIAAIWSGSSA